MMGFMEKVGAKLATKYGTVYKGKHAGCQVALGNPPNKKVEFSNGFSQIIFVEGAEEKGRYDIVQDVGGISLMSYDEKAFQLAIVFKNEEHCFFNLEIRQEDTPVAGMIKGFLGQKNTVSASPQEKMELQYRGVKVFLQNTAIKFLISENIQTLRDYLQKRDILDEITMKILDVALEHAKALEENI